VQEPDLKPEACRRLPRAPLGEAFALKNDSTMPGELSRHQASAGFYAERPRAKTPPIPAFCRTRQRLSRGPGKTDPYAPFYNSSRATEFKQRNEKLEEVRIRVQTPKKTSAKGSVLRSAEHCSASLRGAMLRAPINPIPHCFVHFIRLSAFESGSFCFCSNCLLHILNLLL
jgi:hypothetical protein